MLSKHEYDQIKEEISELSPIYANTLDYLIKRELGRVVKRKRKIGVIFLSIFHVIFLYQRENKLSKVGDNNILFVDLMNRRDHKKKFVKWASMFTEPATLQRQKGANLITIFSRFKAVGYGMMAFPVVLKLAKLLKVDILEFLLLIRYFIRFEIERSMARKVCEVCNLKVIATISVENYRGFSQGVRDWENRSGKKVVIVTAQHGILGDTLGFPEERCSDVYIAWAEHYKHQILNQSVYEKPTKIIIGCSLDVKAPIYDNSAQKTSPNALLYLSSPNFHKGEDVDKIAMRLVMEFANSMHEQNLDFKIRLHPGSPKANYSFVPNALLENVKEKDLNDSLEGTKFVIGLYSTSIVQAAMQGKKCFSVSLSRYPKVLRACNIEEIVEKDIRSGLFFRSLKETNRHKVNESDIKNLVSYYYGECQMMEVYKKVILSVLS